MRRSKAFTLIELLVVVAIIALLISILLPSLSRARELSKRTVCMANLSGLGKAMYIYAQDDPQVFPAIAQVFSGDTNNLHLFFEQDRTTAPATTGVPSPTVNMWTVVKANNTTPKQFICPSTTNIPDRAQDTTVYYDFAEPENLSYGMQYQASPRRRVIGTSSEPTFPFLGDANPYVSGLVPGNASQLLEFDRLSIYRGNSVNHTNREGQNILFQDSHVDWEKGPDVGISGRTSGSILAVTRGRDHCYTVHGTTLNATVDYGSAAPDFNIANAETETGSLRLGSKSDACLTP